MRHRICSFNSGYPYQAGDHPRMRAHRLGLNLNTVAAATVPATKYAAIVATAAAGRREMGAAQMGRTAHLQTDTPPGCCRAG